MSALSVGLVLLGVNAVAALDGSTGADDLVERAFANLYSFSSSQKIALRARQGDGKEFVRTARVLRRGSEHGLNRMLVRFVDPPDLRGVGVLLEERDDYSYDAFLYQPIYKIVRRISVAQRHDPFFGTDVYFEDLESKRASQWDAQVVRKEVVDGNQASVIELTPVGFPSGYDRIVGWFDHDRPIMLKTEFYRDGDRLKVLKIDPRRVVEVEGYLIPSLLVFRGERGSTTTLEITDIKMRAEIPDESFTRSALEFGSERSPVWERE